MPKQSVRLQIDSDRLRAAVASKETWTERAEKYGVTKQAVNAWLSEGLIPARALIEIARDLELGPDVIDEILAPQKKKAFEKGKKKWILTVTLEES